MWSVTLLDEVAEWLLALAKEDSDLADRVEAAINLLEQDGPSLGRPTADRIKGSKLHNLKELRASTVRILFVFDPAQQAILLVAGDKAGQWQKWYRDNIPVAEQRYAAWLAGDYAEEE